MRKFIFSLIILSGFFSQSVFAVHPLPSVPNNCLYVVATPHRPDPRDPELTTPEQRCQAADTFALSNVPTTPVGVITPSGEPRYYCTLDGSTPAVPMEISDTDPELAATLPGATPCSGDAVCADLFGEDASCELFGPDASGRGTNGWVSLGPASSITLASDLDGDPGAHSVYIRSPGGEGNIFYFQRGMNRTHSLTAGNYSQAGQVEVLDITICKASGPIVQRTRPPESQCTGFFCRPIQCCGPHFPCDGYPDLSALLQEPEDRIAGLDLELEALIDGGELGHGQGSGMRQILVSVVRMLEQDKTDQACNHLQHFIDAIGHNVINGSLNPEDAGPLGTEAVALQDELACSVSG